MKTTFNKFAANLHKVKETWDDEDTFFFSAPRGHILMVDGVLLDGVQATRVKVDGKRDMLLLDFIGAESGDFIEESVSSNEKRNYELYRKVI